MLPELGGSAVGGHGRALVRVVAAIDAEQLLAHRPSTVKPARAAAAHEPASVVECTSPDRCRPSSSNAHPAATAAARAGLVAVLDRLGVGESRAGAS